MSKTDDQFAAKFRELLQALNTAQRSAVDQIEGPVLVIAGPGTGKTHVLAARVGNILLHTDTRPQSILCLTFTDAGVLAMRRRLLDLIGPDAFLVPVFTYHSFCNRIIQENLEYFGRRELEPLSELEHIGIVRQILDAQGADHPLREGRKDHYAYEVQLRHLFGVMKRENWKPGYIQRHVDNFLKDLPNNPDYQYKRNNRYGRMGEPNPNTTRDITRKMGLLHAAADLYPIYEKTLQKAGRYEFDDMLLWVIAAFEKQEALLRKYQERYLYFLVDEFQDTNTAQFRLLQLLLYYWDTPNVFIVGDDDQSIFEFQGARLQNLVNFSRDYAAGLHTVVLQENYRSTQPILDAAKRVIEFNLLRAVKTLDIPLEKNLRAVRPDQDAPLVRIYENRIQEISHIADEIERLAQSGIPLNEIAVLYPQHKQAERLMTLLQRRQIPFQTRRPVDIRRLPPVQQLLELIHYLCDELAEPYRGDHRLFRILHAPFWAIRPIDLARIALALRRSAEAGTPTPWREALNDRLLLEGLQLDTPVEDLLALGRQLDAWVADVQALPPGPMLERLVTRSGLLTMVLAHPDKIWWLQVLHSFQEFILQQSARNPDLRLEGVLDLLQSMEENRLPLALQQTLRTGDGVHLLSVHAAKGLEFDQVFLLDSTEDFWEPSTRSASWQFTLPETLTLSTAEEDALEARRRLFYVAMTRARRGLYIGYSRNGADGKPLKPARFVAETGLESTDIPLDPARLAEAQALWLQEPEPPEAELPEGVWLDEVLQQFRLSITSLNRFLRCPLAFYYEDILKVPSPPSEAAAFGQAMHHAVQHYFLAMRTAAPGLPWPPDEVLLEAFEKSLQRRRGLFSAAAFDQRRNLGREFLRAYHQEQIPYWRRRAVVERNIDRAALGDIPLTGVVDKIEWLDDGTLRVVDYKTGQFNRKKIEPPGPDAPHGGEFWRQMVFYKLLLDSARMYVEPVSTAAIAWLEPDRNGKFPVFEVNIQSEAVATLSQTIRNVWSSIQDRDFYTGCGKADCDWCRLHYEQTLPTQFSREEEALDDER